MIKKVDIVERADQMCKHEGDCRPALLLYSQAIEERGESAELYKKRGMAYYSLKRIDDAVKDFSKAIELSKDKDVELYFIRGLSRSLLPDEDRAGSCSDLSEAIRLGWKLAPEFDSWYAEYCGKK